MSYKCVQTITELKQRKIVDDAYCPTISKSSTYEKCMGQCRSAVWTFEEWSPCSRSCGGGSQTRSAFCTSHHKGFIIDENYCAKIPKEELVRSCNQIDCPTWSYGEDNPVSFSLELIISLLRHHRLDAFLFGKITF